MRLKEARGSLRGAVRCAAYNESGLHLSEKKGLLSVRAEIYCERDSHKGIIIGKQGVMLKKIGSTARYEIERMLDMQVNLKLWVKVKEDWQDDNSIVKRFKLQ